MISVATGGGIKASPNYCEKYPSDADCQQYVLPMLLMLPRINDYQGGYVMLGLGDIVLPGLLVSLAARFDSASGVKPLRGFFLYILVGYACGLLLANVAVIVFNSGQPALLYLVPCTLVPFLFISKMDRTLPELWEGPACLCDDMNPQGYLRANADEEAEWPRTATSRSQRASQEIVQV